MRSLPSVLFLMLLFSCSDASVKEKEQALTPNQRSIISDYNSLEHYLRTSSDSLEQLSLRMQQKAVGEPGTIQAMAEIVVATDNSSRARYRVARVHYENALKLLGTSGPDTLRGRANAGLGTYFRNTGDYPSALKYLLKGLSIYEQAGYLNGIVSVNGLIGDTYMQKNDLESARKYLTVALEKGRPIRHRYSYLNASHALANVYGMEGNYAKALELDREGIRICDSVGHIKLKTAFLDNKANCFLYSGQLDSAAYYFNECLKIDQAVGDQKQVADTYSNLGHLENSRRNFEKAEAYVVKSLEMLQEIGNSHNILKCHQILVKIYKDSGQKDKAIAAQETYMKAYAKVMGEKKQEALAEFEVIHETEKKEKIISQNRVKLLQSEEALQRRNYWIGIISLLALFSALVLFLVNRQHRLKNRQQQQEHELKTAIARIESQNELQEQRLAISRDLHDNIGSQLTFVISSVDNLRYAFDLSGSKLDEKLQHISQFTQSTIVELRDTIWAMNRSEIGFDDLKARIYNFIDKARMARQDIVFRFEIDQKLEGMQFSSVNGMNVYRSIQEAVNNAIKHSGATQVDVNISGKADQVLIEVSDNGKGFSDVEVAEGNGLKNIRRRIEEIGGSFSLNSTTSGTRVSILINSEKS